MRKKKLYDELGNEWITKDQSEEEIDHSRAKLLRQVIAVEKAGGHVVYCDTDSIKYIPSGDGATEQIFDRREII